MRERGVMKRKISIVAALLAAVTALFGVFACQKTNPKTEGAVVQLNLSGYRQEFEYGERFSSEGLIVSAEFDDGSMRNLSESEYIVKYDSFKSNVAGTYSIGVETVLWDIKAEYSVTVKEKPVHAASIRVVAAKKSFVLGTEFSADDLRVNAVDAAGREKALAADEITVDSSSYDKDAEGDYIIRVKMNETGFTDKYTVKVRQDYSESFKILAIGNSFSDDATEYLSNIARAYGYANVVVGNLYVGGCTLDLHKSYAQQNQGVYEYRKTDNGVFTNRSNFRVLDALKEEAWDIVSLQQGSHYSGLLRTYNEDLDYLVNFVKQYCPNRNVKLVWHMTWAYQDDTTHWAYASNYDANQNVMYQSIVNCVQRKIDESGEFGAVFPVGTAIQNARTSTLGDTLTRDGYHLTLDVGRFIAGLTWFAEATGADVDRLPTSCVPSSAAAHIEIIKESVKNALAHPYSVSQSAYAPKNPVLPDLSEYTLLDYEAVSGYRNATDGAALTGVISDAEDSSKYFTTQLFEKSDLPVGTLIVLESGWVYRPEGWLKADEPTAERERNVSASFKVIDENWWDEYRLRAFNVSRLTGAVPDRDTDVRRILRIYIPKPVSLK